MTNILAIIVQESRSAQVAFKSVLNITDGLYHSGA